jgi:predicted DNA-binding transcriptional regulator AlpA
MGDCRKRGGINRSNARLREAFALYPPETWTFEVLERLPPGCSTEALCEAEQHHIDRLRSQLPAFGFNMEHASWTWVRSKSRTRRRREIVAAVTEKACGLDVTQVCKKLGVKVGDGKPLNPSTVWRRTRNDPDFPRPFYLWNAAPRWVEEEIDDYIRKKIAERDDPVCAEAQRERQARREERVKEPRARAQERKRKAKSRGRRSRNGLQTPEGV